jgi:uncharacterized protein (DUF433 family)
MALVLKSEPVPLRMDKKNTIRVGNTRITLDLVIEAYLGGASAENIAEMFDTLDLGDVHSVIGWYLHHKEAVQEYLRERQQHANDIRAQIEADPEQARFREQILSRLPNKQ